MSLKGNAEGKTLRGRINRLYELRGYSAYEVAVINGFQGTEEEWLASIMADSKNVKNYGAVGDGVADDTEAVRKAMASGGAVYFPAGTYLITDTLHIVKESTASENDTSLWLYGDGAAKSVLHYTGDGYLFDINCRYNYGLPVIEGFDFVGTDNNSLLRASAPGLWGACFVLRNFRAKNFNTVCMELVSAFHCVIENGVLRTSGKVKTYTHSGKQTLGNYSNCVTWRDVIFTRPTSESANAPCYFEFFNVKKFVFIGCQFQFADVLFTNTGNVSDINCENCWFEQLGAIYDFDKISDATLIEGNAVADDPITTNCYFTAVDSFNADTVTKDATGAITAVSRRFAKLPGRDDVLVQLAKGESRNNITLIDEMQSANEVVFSRPRFLDKTATSIANPFPYTISSKMARFDMPLNCVTFEKDRSALLAQDIASIIKGSSRSCIFDVILAVTHYDNSYEVLGAKVLKLGGTLVSLGSEQLYKPTGNVTAATSVIKFSVANAKDASDGVDRLTFRAYEADGSTELRALKWQMFVRYTFTDATI